MTLRPDEIDRLLALAVKRYGGEEGKQEYGRGDQYGGFVRTGLVQRVEIPRTFTHNAWTRDGYKEVTETQVDVWYRLTEAGRETLRQAETRLAIGDRVYIPEAYRRLSDLRTGKVEAVTRKPSDFGYGWSSYNEEVGLTFYALRVVGVTAYKSRRAYGHWTDKTPWRYEGLHVIPAVLLRPALPAHLAAHDEQKETEIRERYMMFGQREYRQRKRREARR